MTDRPEQTGGLFGLAFLGLVAAMIAAFRPHIPDTAAASEEPIAASMQPDCSLSPRGLRLGLGLNT